MEMIDKVALGVLEEVARDVIGKTMSVKDHEELILKSLDNIKNSSRFKEI